MMLLFPTASSLKSLFFVWASGLWKQIDCCCCCWQTTFSLQQLEKHRRSNVTSFLWQPEDAWNYRELFHLLPCNQQHLPAAFPVPTNAFRLHTLIISHGRPSFWTATNCFLPLWTILVFHVGVLCLWFQQPWYPDLLVCWWIIHSSTQWKLDLC